MTVLETRVHQSWARKARIAFFTVGMLVAVIAALVSSAFTSSPMLTVLVGLVCGGLAGGAAFVAVSTWPYVRIVWWWSGELLAAAALFGLWSAVLSLPMWARGCAALLLFGPLVFARVRTAVVAFGWCFVVRHRLRTCFAQFIVSNRSGSLPLILAARPTPVGERVWIYLRPGLSLADLGNRIEKIAVACHAAAVVVDRASASNSALIRVDIKRREVLGVAVASPLVGTVNDDTMTVPYRWQPDGLDLADTSAVPVSPAAPRWTAPKPAAPADHSLGKPAYKVPGSAEDFSDYID